MVLDELLQLAADSRASDLFLKGDASPALRIDGHIRGTDLPKLSGDEVRDMAYNIMTPEQIGRFERRHEMDLAFTFKDLARFRVNVYQQRGMVGLVLRLIPLKIYSLEELQMPDIIAQMTKLRQGLILVTGPTGSGKSTTLAAMIDLINQSRPSNIVTIEDPIEFVHPDKKSIVNQREISIDTDSFTEALKYVVRQSPDVILIGEMRDVETMNVALAAADTGHLVFSTVHTTGASDTMERIINMFPPHQKQQICLRLSTSLMGIISQRLLPRKNAAGRVAAVEILTATPTTVKLIEEGRSGQLYTAIAEGGFYGMQTMNQCLDRLYKQGLVSEEEALASAGNVTELKQMLRRH
ncbi:MAG: type IV pilus twitching motility protein PilT [Armatimonadetes bacterium]|nr:type IV pilus twitching motility protein PilT [Armatimonadota bacterium]